MRIVLQGKTKSNKDIVIRYPEKEDVGELLKFINDLSDERTFITYQGEHETLKSETKFLESRLKDIENKKAVHLLVFCGQQLIGAAHVLAGDKTEKHVGNFGISISKGFRGEGIGEILMTSTLEEAKKEIPDINIITFTVYSTNLIAQNLYKKMGFAEYGRLPNGIARNDTFEDGILMYKNIK